MTWRSSRWQELVALIALLASGAHAQSGGSASGQGSQQPPEGWDHAGYTIHQSLEIGYRVSDVTGSQQMYDTLVDQRMGPRFLDQSLSMQSQNNDGLLFDNLFIDSFGWGGDPNNALHARVDKDKWYDFRAAFRRDQTDFDYNLLANPLNPPTSSPSIPALSSPHSFYTRRRMSDFDLTILPQSRISFRLGYSHNNITGPSYSSVHEGTDALLYQPWNTTMNSYRFGADLKVAPRTTVSYDQFLDYYKGDTTWQLASFAPALLPGGAGTVELGLPIDTANKNPCAVTSPATSLIDPTGTLTNLTCNAYFGYNRSDRVRTSTPTERISLHSGYFQRLEFNASYAYSSADMNVPFNEFFNGLSSRNRTRQATVTGPGHANRISNLADFGGTFHITERVRVVDTFHLWNYRIPSTFDSTETDWTVPGSGSCALPSCSLLTPISGTTTSTTLTNDQKSFNQDWWRNETDVVWDINKKVGAKVGFRYGDRFFVHVNDFATGDEDRIEIKEYTGLAGIWAKPVHGMRLNFDWESSDFSNTIVRIGPRKESRYRGQASYTPKPWVLLAGSINIWQQSNNDVMVNYQGHNRNYGFTTTLSPRPWISLDVAYNYSNYQQNAFICFNDSNTSLPVVANAGSCTANGYDDSGNPLLTYANYTSGTHYGLISAVLKPAEHVTAEVGYSITNTDGQTPQFNILQPLGSLQYNYQQPVVKLTFDLGHNLAAIGAWNYYQYGEGSFVGPTLPRYFHANNSTFSLRWAF
jgi:hypothetical protein